MAVVAERRVEGRNVECQKLGDELNRFDQVLGERGLVLERAAPEVLQVNVGKLCNLTCIHCHVNAGPKRKEIMTRETVERILDWLRGSSIATVDLTGGAPEMIPDFRYFVSEARAMGRHVMDRCNLTILLEDGYQGLAEFLCEHEVEIVASMPWKLNASWSMGR